MAGRAGQLRHAQRHVDGVAARRRRGRAVPPGASRARRPATSATALQNSADPVPWSGAPTLGYLDYVARQGAGPARHRRRDPRNDDDHSREALAGRQRRVRPGSPRARRGDDEVGGGPRTLTIDNDGSQTVTYTLSNVDALAVAGREFGAEHPEPGASTVAFEQDGEPVTSITVRAHRTAKLDVTITPNPALSEGAVYGGYLVFTPDVGDAPLRVPYAGYKGDYQAVAAMTPTTQRLPVARADDRDHDRPADQVRPVYASRTPAPCSRWRRRRSRPFRPVRSRARAGRAVRPRAHEQLRAAHRDRGLQRPNGTRSVGTAFEQDFVPAQRRRELPVPAVDARDGPADRRHGPCRQAAVPASGRRLLPRADRRAGARRALDADGDLDLADVPDQPDRP